MTFLKAIFLPFLFLAALLPVTAAEPDSVARPVFLAEWTQSEAHAQYVNHEINSNKEFAGLMDDFGKGQLTIREIRAHAEKQGWKNFILESRTVEGKGGAIAFAAVDFLNKALRSLLEDKDSALRQKRITDIEKLLNPSGREEKDLRPLTQEERSVTLTGTIWAAVSYPRDPLQTYGVSFWRRYFESKYTGFARSPTLTTRVTAAAIVTFHITGNESLETIQKESGLEPSMFANFTAEIGEIVYNSPLRTVLESLRAKASAENKGLPRLSAPTMGNLPPLFTGETSGSVIIAPGVSSSSRSVTPDAVPLSSVSSATGGEGSDFVPTGSAGASPGTPLLSPVGDGVPGASSSSSSGKCCCVVQ